MLSLGPHTVTAMYMSDADFVSGHRASWPAPSRSGAVTSTTLAASAASLHYGQAVTFTATVFDQTSAPARPTAWSTSPTRLPASISGRPRSINGTATLPPVPLGVGTHEIVATYLGASEYFGQRLGAAGHRGLGRTGPDHDHGRRLDGQLRLRPARDLYGHRDIRPRHPVGSVDFYDLTTGTDLGTAPLGNGVATTPPITLGVGTNLIGMTCK